MNSGLVFLYIELCEPNQESGPIGRDFRAGAQRMKTSRQSTSCTLITAELARDLKIPGTPPQQLSTGVGIQSAPGYIQAACNSGFRWDFSLFNAGAISRPSVAVQRVNPFV